MGWFEGTLRSSRSNPSLIMMVVIMSLGLGSVKCMKA